MGPQGPAAANRGTDARLRRPRSRTFLDELLELQPDLATAVGRPSLRRPLAGHERGRPRRHGSPSATAGSRTFTGARHGGDWTPDERIDRDLVLGELAEFRFAETELRRGRVGSALLGLPDRRRAAHPDSPGTSRRSPSAWRRSPGGWRACPRIIGDAQAVLGSHPGRARCRRLHAEVAGRRIGGRGRAGARGRGRGRGGSPRRSGRGRPAATAARRGGRWRPAPSRGSASTWSRRSRRPRPVTRLLGEALFAAKLRHTLRDPDITPERVLARAEARVRRRPRGDGADRPRALAGLAPGRAAAGRRWRAGSRHARRDRAPSTPRPTTSSRSAARSWRGSRRSAASVTSSAWWRSRSRSTGRPSSCARSPARCSNRPGPLDARPEDVLLDHPGPRGVGRGRGRVVPAGDEHPPAAAAHDPRGGARPLPPGRLRQPRHVAGPARVPVGPVRRGLGRVRHAGDARPRVRRATTPPCGSCTGSSTCGRWPTRSSTSGSTRLGMTSEEAIALMVDGAFQERAEAVAKDERARLSSTQLVDVLPRLEGMWDIEDEARRRAASRAVATPCSGRGDRAGAPARRAAIPRRPPGLRPAGAPARLSISHGAPPIPILRQMLLMREQHEARDERRHRRCRCRNSLRATLGPLDGRRLAWVARTHSAARRGPSAGRGSARS